MSKKDIVYYGYPNPKDYKEFINLILTHDKIYDPNGALDPLFSSTPYFAEMFDDLNNENNDFKAIFADKFFMRNYSDTFVFLSSIMKYYGLDEREWWTIQRKGERYITQRILSLDDLKKVNQKNSEKFINIIIPALRRAKKINPEAFKKTIDILNEVPLLKKQVIPRKKYFKEERKVKDRYGNLIFEAMDLDEKDPEFCSIVKEEINQYDPKSNTFTYDPKWESFLINDQILMSSEFGMSLFLDERYSNLIRYKFLRGAKPINDLKRDEGYKEAYKLFIPEIYAKDVKDIINLKNQKVFTEFRKETSSIIDQWFEDSSNKSNFSEYLNELYIKEMENFTSNNTPSNKKVVLEGFVGNLDSLFCSIPLFGTLMGGKKLIDTHRDKKKYKFCLSVIGIKDKISKLS